MSFLKIMDPKKRDHIVEEFLKSKQNTIQNSRSEVDIIDNDIFVDNETFDGTHGLWELITSKTPDANMYTREDYENCKDILLRTNAIIDPNTGKVKSSSSTKYNTIIKPIYEEHLKPQRRIATPQSPSLTKVPATATLLPPPTGKGVIILPSDPNALVGMLPERYASLTAGNTVTNCCGKECYLKKSARR